MSVGLICEFNPFHFGHRYIIDKIKEITNEPVICIMSGPFIQRAEPACADKFVRTRVALKNGADAVIELPVKFSTAAAHNFARGGVEVLKNIHGVSALAFGVETENIELLYKIVQIKKLPKTNEAIKAELDKGKSYPEAVALSVAKISGDDSLINILTFSNNILAVEYIEALEQTNISALPILRVGNNYKDTDPGRIYASATAIRENLTTASKLEKYLPSEMLSACLSCAPNKNLFDSLVLYALRKMSLSQLRELPDVECGLEYQLQKAALMPTLQEALKLLKSKRYTYARLKRIFLYALIGIDRQIMSDINSIKTRVLGIKKEFKPFLSDLNSNIITRNSEANQEFRNDKSVMIDAFSDDIYSLLRGTEANAYYKIPMIVV